MLFSRKEGVPRNLRAIQIHGAAFYDIVFTVAESAAAMESARIGGEMIYANARPGDRVAIEKIANVVMRVEKL